MANSRTVTLAAALGFVSLLLGTSLAAPAEGHRHRQHGKPRITVTAPEPGVGGGGWVTYRVNPFAGYRWFGAGWSVGLGDWGSTPVYYPFARAWRRAGDPSDPACNMPSSPCWDQDRE
jgi:hypothetical protein